MRSIRHIFLILLVLFFCESGIARQDRTLTEKQRREKREEGRAQVRALLDQARALRDKDPKKALKIEEQALAIAEKNTFDKLLGQVYYDHCLTYYHLGELNKCRQLLHKALSHQERYSDTFGIANSLFTLSGVLLSQNEVSQVLPFLERGIKLAEITGDKDLLRSGYTKLAGYYRGIGDFAKSLEYFEQALAMAKQLKEKDRLAATYNSIGATYYQMDSSQLALEYFTKSAEAYKRTDKLVSLSEVYSNLGAAYNDLGLNDKALENYSKSLTLQKQVGESGLVRVALLHNMAIVYAEQQKFAKAEAHYREALKEARATGMKDAQLSSLENLSEVLKSQGKYKESLEYLKQANRLQDTLYNEEGARMQAELQQKFEAERSSKKIQLLKKDLELNQARISRRTWERNGTIGVLIVSVLVSLLVIRSYRLRQRAMADLAGKIEELNQQRMNEMVRKQELRSVHALMEGQEQERRRIASELHDRLGSVLATVKLHYKTAIQHLSHTPEIAADQLGQANSLLDKAIDEVRRISHNMASGVLRKFGLVHAIQELREAIVATGQINMEVLVYGYKHRLDSSIEIPAYRIVQELVSNILRHAKANSISVQINFFDDLLNIVVEDDGIGFDPNQQSEVEAGIGLRNLKARVSQLQGTFLIDSGLGNGTTIIIDVPLQQKTSGPASVQHQKPAVTAA